MSLRTHRVTCFFSSIRKCGWFDNLCGGVGIKGRDFSVGGITMGHVSFFCVRI